jgi:hypothetical protein
MSDFFINKKEIEAAMQVACLSTEPSEEINGQALFDASEQCIKIISTDRKTKLSKTEATVNMFSGDPCVFTSDPRKILSLLKTGDSELIKFSYDDTNKTLKIFLSEDLDSYISLPSMDPSEYAIDSSIFDKPFDVKSVNAGILITGIQFIKDFLDQKDQKFSNLYISKGIMYGSNGVNKAAAFTCPNLSELDDLLFPISTIPSIINFLNITNTETITISTSSHHVFLKDGSKNIIGFTKVQIPMPKMPVAIDEPEAPGWVVNKKEILKKLARLRLSKDAHVGIKGIFSENKLQLETVLDRGSKDCVACSPIKEFKQEEFLTECKIFENAIDQFQSDEIRMFINRRIYLHESANIEITEKDGSVTLTPFKNSAVIAFSRQG